MIQSATKVDRKSRLSPSCRLGTDEARGHMFLSVLGLSALQLTAEAVPAHPSGHEHNLKDGPPDITFSSLHCLECVLLPPPPLLFQPRQRQAQSRYLIDRATGESPHTKTQ